MAAQTLGKALGIMGITPSVVEVFFVDHEEKVMKAKFADHLASQGISYDTDEEYNYRFGIYSDHDKEIDVINGEQDDFKVAHNKFSTWAKDEIDAIKGLVPHNDATEPKELGSE
jgi:homoserine trans-succinylase